MAEPDFCLDDQVACLKREIAMRERVYARQVQLGRMKTEVAQRELATMRACLTTLVRYAYVQIVREAMRRRQRAATPRSRRCCSSRTTSKPTGTSFSTWSSGLVEPVEIPLDAISIGGLVRRPRRARIAAVAASIRAEGQKTPIEVSPAGPGAWRLTRGAVRVMALRLIGATMAVAIVKRATADERRRREIDDNLAGDGCTVLDRARYLAIRKDLYEAEHPEARHGAAPWGGRIKSPDLATLLSFTAWATEVYGQAERSIQRFCTIGERLDAIAADYLAETDWADNQTALEQISRLEAGVQQEVARLLVRDPDPVETVGEAIAMATGQAVKEQIDRNWSAATRAFDAMSARDRRLFVHEVIVPRLPSGMRIVDELEASNAA